MKNKFSGILCSFAVLALLSSCKDEKNYPIYEPPTDVVFKLETGNMDFLGNATQPQVMIATSPRHLNVTVDDDWCSVELNKFTDKYKFEYKIYPKASLEARSTVVRIYCDSILKDTFVVSQTPCVAGWMGLGWNMGNQLEANNNGVSNETCWGNDACTQATMDAVKAAGFESVRIPITWKGHIIADTIGYDTLVTKIDTLITAKCNYTLEDAWVNRVKEVVGYAKNAGLKAIINIHHDDSMLGIDESQPHKGAAAPGSWINIYRASLYTTERKEIASELAQVWEQIAMKFADFSADELMFETMNEVQDGSWGAASKEMTEILNAWNDTIVKVIRATGGANANRWIGVPGYAASLASVISEDFVKPADDKVAVSIHCYDPYKFCLEATENTWGVTKEGDRDEAAYNAIENVMFTIADNFINKGVNAYLGEFGCAKRASIADEPYRLEWLRNFANMARTYGISLFLWDNGATAGGRESHAYFNHGTGAFEDGGEDAVNAILKGYRNE